MRSQSKYLLIVDQGFSNAGSQERLVILWKLVLSCISDTSFCQLFQEICHSHCVPNNLFGALFKIHRAIMTRWIIFKARNVFLNRWGGVLGVKMGVRIVPRGYLDWRADCCLTTGNKPFMPWLMPGDDENVCFIDSVNCVIEVEWRMYASVKQAIIGTNNGLVPNMRKAINWTKLWRMVNCILKNKIQWNFNQDAIHFSQANAIVITKFKMSATAFRSQCVNHDSGDHICNIYS